MCFLVALIIVTVIVIIIVVVLIVIVIITFRNLFHVLAGGVELERALFLLDCEVKLSSTLKCIDGRFAEHWAG